MRQVGRPATVVPTAATPAISLSSLASTSRARSASTAASSSAHSPAAGKTPMPWEQYFKYRKSRRVWGTVAAIPTTLAGCIIGGGKMH